MKKLIGLLFSIWIPLYLLFALLASCEKSTVSNDKEQTKDATAARTENAIANNTCAPQLAAWGKSSEYKLI